MFRGKFSLLIIVVALFMVTAFGQNNQLPLSNSFMNEIKTFLTEEGFSPNIEDVYLGIFRKWLSSWLVVL